MFAAINKSIHLRKNGINSSYTGFIKGEVVTVIRDNGVIAEIKPYSSKYTFIIKSEYLNYRIPQDTNCYIKRLGALFIKRG